MIQNEIDTFLEDNKDFKLYIDGLVKLKNINKFKGKIGGVVMNCNPFTLGHRYLIEQSLNQVDYLYIFVVEEEKLQNVAVFVDGEIGIVFGPNDPRHLPHPVVAPRLRIRLQLLMAVLGDQKQGRNIEAPEDLIRKIVREEASNGAFTFIAQLNGKTIFNEGIDQGKLQQRTTGKNPFKLGAL